jgi:hypothetical protein
MRLNALRDVEVMGIFLAMSCFLKNEVKSPQLPTAAAGAYGVYRPTA